MSYLLFLAVCFLAFTNGANDNFKGVATLFGAGIVSLKKAITWSTATTLLGSVASIFLAGKLLENFSGKGLVTAEVLTEPAFVLSLALGAALTVFLATKVSMPVSTTHALIGALAGAGIISIGGTFNFEKLLEVFLLPMILSPIMALVVSFFGFQVIKSFQKSADSRSDCICVEQDETLAPYRFTTSEFVLEKNRTLSLQTCKTDENKTENTLLSLEKEKVLNVFHFISSGLVCFARGLNDTPKIVGIMLVLPVVNHHLGLLLVGLAMAIGGVLKSKKVGVTMSKKITPMSSKQGLLSNLTTSSCVIAASTFGLPVSTTHVSVGSIFGIGIGEGRTNYSTVLKIVMSWLITLPVAFTFAGIVYIILKLI